MRRILPAAVRTAGLARGQDVKAFWRATPVTASVAAEAVARHMSYWPCNIAGYRSANAAGAFEVESG